MPSFLQSSFKLFSLCLHGYKNSISHTSHYIHGTCIPCSRTEGGIRHHAKLLRVDGDRKPAIRSSPKAAPGSFAGTRQLGYWKHPGQAEGPQHLWLKLFHLLRFRVSRLLPTPAPSSREHLHRCPLYCLSNSAP